MYFLGDLREKNNRTQVQVVDHVIVIFKATLNRSAVVN